MNLVTFYDYAGDWNGPDKPSNRPITINDVAGYGTIGAMVRRSHLPVMPGQVPTDQGLTVSANDPALLRIKARAAADQAQRDALEYQRNLQLIQQLRAAVSDIKATVQSAQQPAAVQRSEAQPTQQARYSTGGYVQTQGTPPAEARPTMSLREQIQRSVAGFSWG